KRTGRTLVVDWRCSRFNTDASQLRNCFEDWFQPLASAGGVEVISDDTVGAMDWRGATLWPSKWTAEHLQTAVHLSHTADELQKATDILTTGTDMPQDVVVFNSYLLPWPPKVEARQFFEQLRFSREIEEEVSRIRRLRGGRAEIAIHIRHGNGENIGGRAAFWLRPFSLLTQLRLNKSRSMHG